MFLITDKQLIGSKFKKYRKLNGLTQFELAEKIGLNEKQISRIESGQNYPTYLTFVKLIEILNINILDFLNTNKQQHSIYKEELLNLIENSKDADLELYIEILNVIKKRTNI